MPQQINYYDPEEIRRRQLLNPTSEMGGPEQENPFTAQVNAPEDDGDEAAGDVHATPTPANAQLSPAMQKYQQVMAQQPTPSQHPPSRGRRILAAVAGGLTGIKDPGLGVKVAGDLVSQPYQRAMGDWQVQQQAAQTGMTFQEKAQADSIAQQRATAYGVSSQARMKAAQSNEAYRRAQEANMPYHPHNLNEEIETNLSKRGIVKSGDQFKPVIPPRDYTGEENLKAKHAKELQDLRTKQAKDLENSRAGHASSLSAAHDARVSSREKQQAPATPKSQEEAEQMAVQELLRQKPEYKDFVHDADTNKKTGRVVRPSRDNTPDELPKEGDDNPNTRHFLGLGQKLTAAQAALARAKYAEFLVELDKHKRVIVGRPTGGSRYTVEEDQ